MLGRVLLVILLQQLLLSAAYHYHENHHHDHHGRDCRHTALLHECRACVKPEADSEFNCPAVGFDCGDASGEFSTEERPADHHCVAVKCALPNYTLIVAGKPISRLTCNKREWRYKKSDGWTEDDVTTKSAVCLRSCGEGACPLGLPATPYAQNLFDAVKYSAANEQNPCGTAWCDWEAILYGTEDGNEKTTRPINDRSLTCTGSGRWKDSNGEKYKHTMCRTCRNCDSTAANVRRGYPPKSYFNGEYPVEQFKFRLASDTCEFSQCPGGQALRATTTLDQSIASMSGGEFYNDGKSDHQLTCNNGQWVLKYLDRILKTELYANVTNTECYRGNCITCNPMSTSEEISVTYSMDPTTFCLTAVLSGCTKYKVKTDTFTTPNLRCASDNANKGKWAHDDPRIVFTISDQIKCTA